MSPERIYKKSFNKANKKIIAPNLVLTKVDDLIKQLSSLSINIANIQDKLYSLTNRERNRYALGFYSRLIVTAGVQGQDIEASSDAEDRDIAINIISGTYNKELRFGRYDLGTSEIFLSSAALFSQVLPSLGNKFISAGSCIYRLLPRLRKRHKGIPILIDRKAPRKRLSSRQLTFVVDLTLNFGRIRVNYEAFTDKVMPAAISLFNTPKIMQDLPRMQVRVSSLKSPIMLALLNTSAKTNILTTSIARDLNLEYRPI
ncbi:hypothetical protein L249_5234 [Ophiocordyceps polyrhachis-furcata BCC 54312]|uniref:Uncharacterized protein n=1 Tax=Ophiocordyceps polyrhachis-furcata BCC 54312 TaxID=1330021 RepID=A0A367L8X3_9HYPO|nr:hypothetical protein L249_5234 [Ophiocordyceps polyrhachis-furcata BCC 54312]